ncbi:UPF0489 protein C5orf22 homolog isoform X2 [Antedon mediterranea]|uniref:UPF0489 protein C5orf22 homolog isoform X2 n=1 Tax=Antedon mediterranea TaxID=105859 RepID=UPI003AF612FF
MLKNYKCMPVYIVENHQEALPHIYRAIGSRHLPLDGMVMVHFDAHPDLMIATDMKSNIVCNKQALFEVTWPDSYFLSDVLFATKDELENVKEVKVSVVDMETPLLKRATFKELERITKEINKKRNIKKHQTISPVSDGTQNDQAGNQSKSVTDTHTHKVYSEDKSEKEMIKDAALNMSNKPHSSLSNNISSKTQFEQTSIVDDKFHDTNTTEKMFEVISKAIEGSKAYLLDIDLDFFSTKNPFRDMYTEEQYDVLKNLYDFIGPADDSISAVNECQKVRTRQLIELELALKADLKVIPLTNEIKQFNCYSDISQLITSIRETSPETPDWELIHSAGMSCDNTDPELPHHISTEEEIKSLMTVAESLIAKLPSPTLITMSRSSYDDYCPPEYVDNIQQQTLKMLQRVFGQIDVHHDYDTEDNEEEKGQ